MKLSHTLTIVGLVLTASTILMFENCAPAKFSSTVDLDLTTSAVPSAVAGLCFTGPTAGGAGTSTSDCASGFKGNWYYYPDSLRVPRTHGNLTVLSPPAYLSLADFTSNEAWDQGVAYSQLNVPSTDFLDGLQVYDPTQKSLAPLSLNGKPVTEWFAMKLEGYFHLAASDQPGTYQFAMISDDGSQLFYLDDVPGHQPKLLIDDSKPDGPNNGYLSGTQSARMGCSTQFGNLNAIQALPVAITASSNIHLKILWYQGPQRGLAFTMVYRKVPSTGLGDSSCEIEGADYSAGGSGFTDLHSRGWKTVSSENLSASH